MRKILGCLAAVGIVMSVSPAMGQGNTNTTQRAGPVKRDPISARLEKLNKALTLSDEQKASIKAILTVSRDKALKIRDEANAKTPAEGSDTNAVAAAKAAADARVTQISADERQGIRAALTPAQIQKFDEMYPAQKGPAAPAP